MRARLLVLSSALVACSTAGSAWMAEPLPGSAYDETLRHGELRDGSTHGFGGAASGSAGARRVIVLGDGAEPAPLSEVAAEPGHASLSLSDAGSVALHGGRSLGTFRNTYYDFPNESDFDGPLVALKGPRCETLKQVPRSFHDSLCVQGSGRLASGATVSFSRRDCECAEVCPRTGERICFDALDASRYPFGRGATGRAITPLYTVAVDSSVIPLGTSLYVPELRGLPREGRATHDGCFLAEDRGIRVKGKQVDVFTGDPRVTAVYNRLLPSNRGVTVVVGSSRCAAPGAANRAR
jgi:3D (Asp-Asp-Asp) domain-containing protein